MTLRVGVIGLGKAGLTHARHLAAHADVAGVVLIGRDADRVEAARASLGATRAPVTTSVSSITDAAASVDAVVIATSTPSHPQLTREAAAAGLPVLVEKPLSLDVGELETLADDLEASGARVMVGFHRRYDPGYQELRRRVAAGAAGRPRAVHSTGHDGPRLAHDYIAGSGGIWLDMMIHDFDVIPWVLGDPIATVDARGAVLDDEFFASAGDVDTCAALLTTASGTLVTVTGARGNGAGQDVRLEVLGSDGSLGAGVESRTPITSTEPGIPAPPPPYRDYVERFAVAFAHEIDHFVRFAAGDDTANLTPPRAGLDAVRVARAATRSARDGVTVDLCTPATTRTGQHP